VILALGDSITDGAASTPHSYNSWPDHLAQRLSGRGTGHRDMAVINHGISGNQLLSNGAGSSTLGRFDRDVLATPGLTHIVVMIGINDIGTGGRQFPGSTAPPAPMRTAEDLIAGYRQLILRARSESPSVKIYGATLTPFAGTFEGYYTPEKDQVRMAVNQWIRTGGAYDGVIDFEKAIQDPGNPARMAPRMVNDLMPWAMDAHPNLARLKERMEAVEPAPVRVMMSGSGPTLFALYDTEENCQRAAGTLAGAAPFVMATRTVV